MAIRIKGQKSYYLTEVSIDIPANVADVDELVKGLKTNGKMIVVYSGGSTQGINIEQRTPITNDSIDEKIRALIGIETIRK